MFLLLTFKFLNVFVFAWYIKLFFFMVISLFVYKAFFSSIDVGVETKLIFFIISVGITPYLFSLTLYYLLLLLPGMSDSFYLSMMLLMVLALVLFSCRFSFSVMKDFFVDRTKNISELFKKYKYLLFPGFFLVIFFILGWSYYIFSKELSEHDTLEYAVQGKMFYELKKISYRSVPYYPENGFYYVGLHGFSFPLLATLERITNGIIHSGDLFFRSINSFYGILILWMGFLELFSKTNRWYALVFVATLLSVYSFFETIMKYHIDNFRVFFVVTVLFYFVKLVNNFPVFNRPGIMAVLLGAMANAHSLGFMLTFLLWIPLFFLLNESFRKRVAYIVFVIFLMMLFGGIHYPIDMMAGTGWIFQNVKFY